MLKQLRDINSLLVIVEYRQRVNDSRSCATTDYTLTYLRRVLGQEVRDLIRSIEETFEGEGE